MSTEIATFEAGGQPAFGLYRDAFGRLVLVDAEGRRIVGVAPVRAFPITDPQHWVSICDVNGAELLRIDDVDTLPEPSRQALDEALAAREFVPSIARIMAVSAHSESAQWDVQTDRGVTSFLVNSEDDVRRLSPHQVMIVDTLGIRYLIRDTRKLDAHSRRILERYL